MTPAIICLHALASSSPTLYTPPSTPVVSLLLHSIQYDTSESAAALDLGAFHFTAISNFIEVKFTDFMLIHRRPLLFVSSASSLAQLINLHDTMRQRTNQKRIPAVRNQNSCL